MINYEVKIYIPTTNYKALTEVIPTVQHNMADEFGGWTMQEAHGGYLTDAGEEEIESVNVISSLASGWADAMPITTFMKEQAQYVKDTLGEETVLVTINPTGKVLFV